MHYLCGFRLSGVA